MTAHPNHSWRERWPEDPAAFVRAQRARLGLTRAELAGLLGYGEQAVCSWEIARRVPHPSLRQRLLDLAAD